MNIPNPTSSRDPKYVLGGIIIFLLVIVILMMTRKPRDPGAAASEWTTQEMETLGKSLDNALGAPAKGRGGK